jgi:hypothetical protein
MTAIKHAGGVLGLPTPLARLYGLALETGMRVTDGCPQLWDARDEENFSDAAAIVSFPDTICLNPGLDGDDLRADVLAMALSVAAMMVCDESAALPGDVVAPGGFVVITPDRVREPDNPAGRFATMVAQRCGRDTASAAFDCYLPVFSGEPGLLGPAAGLPVSQRWAP